MPVKIIRMATLGLSLDIFCRDLLAELSAEGYEVVAVASPGPELDRVAVREGVRAEAVEMRRRISPFRDIRSLFSLVRLFRREKPHMVHSMTPKAGLLGMMAARLAGVPVRVHTFTGLLFPTATGWRRTLLRLTDRVTCACATHVVPEGEGVKADLLAGGITRKPMAVLGHGNVRGVDLERFAPSPEITAEARAIRSRFDIPPEARVLVFIGRFNRDKGLRELIEAIDMTDGCHLLLVGAGEGEPGDIDPCSLSDNPRIHLSDGWIDDVRPWLAAADALIFPSYREGFPNVVLEAGALELPSIVTDINGSREIITDGANGFVVAPRNARALHDAILRFYALTPDNRQNMGLAARRNVEANFGQRYVRDCLKQFYTEILA